MLSTSLSLYNKQLVGKKHGVFGKGAFPGEQVTGALAAEQGGGRRVEGEMAYMQARTCCEHGPDRALLPGGCMCNFCVRVVHSQQRADFRVRLFVPTSRTVQRPCSCPASSSRARRYLQKPSSAWASWTARGTGRCRGRSGAASVSPMHVGRAHRGAGTVTASRLGACVLGRLPRAWKKSIIALRPWGIGPSLS